MRRKSNSNFWIHYQTHEAKLNSGHFIRSINEMKFKKGRNVNKNTGELLNSYDLNIPFYVSVAHAIAYNVFNNTKKYKDAYNRKYNSIKNKKDISEIHKLNALSDLEGYDAYITDNVSSLQLILFCGFMKKEDIKKYFKYKELLKINKIDSIQLKTFNKLKLKLEAARIQVRDAIQVLQETGLLKTRKVASILPAGRNKVTTFNKEYRGSKRELYINTDLMKRLFSTFNSEAFSNIVLKRIQMNRVMTLKTARELNKDDYSAFVKYQAYYNDTTKMIIAFDLEKEEKFNSQDKYLEREQNDPPPRYPKKLSGSSVPEQDWMNDFMDDLENVIL